MKKPYQLSEKAFQLDGKMPLAQAIPLGLQHVLAMFVGNLTPLLIITGTCGIASGEFADLQLHLLQNAMLVAGIVTLVQLFSVGPIGGNTAKDFGSMENLLLAIFVLAMILYFKHGTKEPLTGRNLSIVAVALGVGYGMGANTGILNFAPQAVKLIFGGSGIVPAAMVAILLNILLPKDQAE